MKRSPLVTTPHSILLTLVLLTVVFTFTQPRVGSFLPWHYTHKTVEFLEEVSQAKEVSAHTYWQFREFYSIGNFTFAPSLISFGETQQLTALPHEKNTLLTYTAERLKSTDFVIKIGGAPFYQEQQLILKSYDQQFSDRTLVFSDESSRIWKDSEHKYILVFVKTIAEMKRVNGFFDYTGPEQKLLSDTVWLNETYFW